MRVTSAEVNQQTPDPPDGYEAALRLRRASMGRPTLPPDERTGDDVYLKPPDSYAIAIAARRAAEAQR